MIKNKYLAGFYISIKDGKEYKIYSNEIGIDTTIECLKNNDFYVERIICKWQINNKNVKLSKLRIFINNSWGKLPLMQKYCILFLLIFVVVALINVFEIPKTKTEMSTVINSPINDNILLDKIVKRIEQEGVKVFVTPNNLVKVENEEIARRIRTIIIKEELIPTGINYCDIFDRERWEITDFERNINFQRSQHRMITDHIKALEGIDDVIVNIIWPKRELFLSDQNTVRASVIIISKLDSDITVNQLNIRGIINLLKYSIEGLTDENITILDQMGNILYNF